MNLRPSGILEIYYITGATYNLLAPEKYTKQGNQRWQTSPAAPPGGLGHSPTF